MEKKTRKKKGSFTIYVRGETFEKLREQRINRGKRLSHGMISNESQVQKKGGVSR